MNLVKNCELKQKKRISSIQDTRAIYVICNMLYIEIFGLFLQLSVIRMR